MMGEKSNWTVLVHLLTKAQRQHANIHAAPALFCHRPVMALVCTLAITQHCVLCRVLIIPKPRQAQPE